VTRVATVAGHFPLTLVTGAGAAARNSIGLVLVGGMTIGPLFTLFVVPSIYMLVAKDHTKDRERTRVGRVCHRTAVKQKTQQLRPDPNRPQH
jgi:multidrug efflux pump